MGNMNAQSMNRADMLRKLQELAFAKVECELYLDAHPECTAALDYYKNIINEYKALAEIYENSVAPIRQENITDGKWHWVDTPWPWQMGGDEK